MLAHPVALIDAVFDKFVERTELPVLVDFWAEWCGPCRAMAPQFEAAAVQLPRVRFAKVDSDANPQASVRQHIRSIPTLILFDRGREVARRSGALGAGELVRWVRGQVPAAC
jgi:thioredoxin 2